MPINKQTAIISTATVLSAAMAVTLASANPDQSPTPAVAAANLDLGLAGGVIDGNSKTMFSGKGTLPLADSYGFQADVFEAYGDGPNRGGVGFHFFQRNPAQHLVGVTSMWGRIGSMDIFRLGGEGELYFNDFTVRLGAGWQQHDGNTTGYGNVKLSYYLTDNLVFSLSGNGFSNIREASLSAEWKPESFAYPLSFVAMVGGNNDSTRFTMFGIRYVWGDDGATLKKKHREYDPPNIVETFMTEEGGADRTWARKPIPGLGTDGASSGGEPPPQDPGTASSAA